MRLWSADTLDWNRAKIHLRLYGEEWDERKYEQCIGEHRKHDQGVYQVNLPPPLLCPLKLKGQFTQKHIHLFQQVFQIKNNKFVRPAHPKQLM